MNNRLFLLKKKRALLQKGFNPRKHFTFFAAESDILEVENDKKSEVLFIQFLCFMKGKLKINGFF